MDEATPLTGGPDESAQGSGTETPQQPDTSQGTSDGQTGTWPKEFQAEFTRWRQAESARADQERQAWSQKESQYQQVVQQLVQRLQQGARSPQGSQQDPFANVKDLPYVDGQTMAQLLTQVQQGYQPVQQQVQQLAATLNLLARQNADLKQQLGGIQGESQNARLDTRFRQVREQLGLPDNPATAELLKDVYYSHEWNGLEEQEFPKYVQERWDALRKLSRELDKTAAQQARQLPFAKRGGEATPSQPLKADGFKTPDELADELAPLLGLQ
jgi:hypothetical protein